MKNFLPLLRMLLITGIVCVGFTTVKGQVDMANNDYTKGWAELNGGDILKAIKHFETAQDDAAYQEKALLLLSMLYTRVNKEPKAEKAFQAYYKTAKNPFPAMYALWFEEAAPEYPGYETSSSDMKFLNKLYDDDRRKGKYDAALDYWLGTIYAFKFNKDKARKYHNKINNIKDWAMVGPFDNVMNSGYDKDFGVLKNANRNATFKSKYGAEISWFDPEVKASDGYVFKETNFRGGNALVYYQTYVKAEQAQDVLIKFGYTGSLKVWLNDAVVYSNPEKRKTEMDYFKFICQLNQGYNRILVQLGDYNTGGANFTLRFTDLDHKYLTFEQSNEDQNYQKNSKSPEAVPFHAVEALTAAAKAEPNDLLHRILLAKAYSRSQELNKAEDILKQIIEEQPDNYLALRGLIFLYSDSGNGTEQNRYYELFKKAYPEDMDVLVNEIDENNNQKDKEKLNELIDLHQSKYSDPFTKITYAIVLAAVDEDYEKTIELIEKLYSKFPDNYQALTSKYRIEKEVYSRPERANTLLEQYLKNHYNSSVIEELADNYMNDGKHKKSINLIQKSIELWDYDIDGYRKLINIYSRQKNYDKAITYCKKIINEKPSDYETLKDLAVLYNIKGDKKNAQKCYEDALRYYPFSFETNEKIRELNDQTQALELVSKIDPVKEIKEYEKMFKPEKKMTYDIVLNNKNFIIYKSKCTGTVREYILKITDEDAIQEWQSLNFAPSPNMRIYLDEAKTIKANGNEIDAERSGQNVVFTKLEVGDYIYVSYTETQERGGKSSLFISDSYNFNSYTPTYKINYNLFVEEGLQPKFEFVNFKLKSKTEQVEGFKKYSWEVLNPTLIKEEPYSLPFSDVANYLHVSLDHSWYDIAQWYSDLSGHQAREDYTIKEISKELFEGKNYTKEEKAKVIYDFVMKNIQYSSIDFRQSNYIPQKASEIYHSRLGDCKDISTLYSAIARSNGLESDLVLINTRNNGQKDVILPSLNFNHCIVKVHLDDGYKFLELTDPELPFGHLYYYHQDAAILEIPSKNINKDISLSYLRLNPGYESQILRNQLVTIGDNLELDVTMDVTKTGTRAAGTCNTYYNVDEKERKEILQSSVASFFNSLVKIKDINFVKLEPRDEESNYNYTFTVESDVLKVGSFRSIKIPFSDKLATLKIFDDEERTLDFNFTYYENTDRYDETIEVKLPAKFAYSEVPENVQLEYEGNKYDLKFEKVNDQLMKVHRIYTVNRTNVKAVDFPDFEKFIKAVIEAEQSHLIFK